MFIKCQIIHLICDYYVNRYDYVHIYVRYYLWVTLETTIYPGFREKGLKSKTLAYSRVFS